MSPLGKKKKKKKRGEEGRRGNTPTFT